MNVNVEVRGRRAKRSEATRGLLVSAARELFAKRGYADVATEEIVRAAGVTRGALYHHFRDKRDLFRAAYERLEQEIAEQIVAEAAGEEDPWKRQLAAVGAFLDICQDEAVQRIALVDAPSVLGWEEWREIEARYGLGLVRGGLEALIDAGLISRQPVEPLAHLILGALMEAGMVIARAADQMAARREVGASIERLLEGLRLGPPPAGASS